ncbi:glycosyltransferase family 2 protein [Reichenbachiella sp.]|uniref:glycosyltransferase family 2 protein n=1 Tax=Reichenbachiella sp. TaxID=2184521 RepID=UPI003B5B364F
MQEKSSKNTKLPPKVSVIIPCYKAAKYIEQTVVSVLDQTTNDFEVIVVVDGSPENETEILERLKAKDDRIKILVQENEGVSRARNNGFSVCKGEYISFLDSDDIWLPNRLEKLMVKMNQGNFGLVQSDIEVIDETGEKKGEIKHGKEGSVLDDLLLWNGDVINAPSSTLIKRMVLEDVGLFDEDLSTAADQELWFRIASKYNVGLVAEPLSFYRKHDSNMSSNISLLERDHLKAYQKAEKLNLFKSSAFRNQCFSNMTMIIAACWMGDGNNWLRGLRLLMKALLIYPKNFTKLLMKIKKKIIQ